MGDVGFALNDRRRDRVCVGESECVLERVRVGERECVWVRESGRNGVLESVRAC